MKTLSVKQPWSYLICSGIKPVENRTWNTHFRGRVLIHSSGTAWSWHKVLNYLTPEMTHFFVMNKYTGTWLRNLNTGSIIGSVEIVNCISVHLNGKGSDSIWAEKGCYHWILRNQVMFAKPILNVKGKLSFWDYEMSEEEYLKIEKI